MIMVCYVTHVDASMDRAQCQIITNMIVPEPWKAWEVLITFGILRTLDQFPVLTAAVFHIKLWICPASQCRSGETGRRAGLKIP